MCELLEIDEELIKKHCKAGVTDEELKDLANDFYDEIVKDFFNFLEEKMNNERSV